MQRYTILAFKALSISFDSILFFDKARVKIGITVKETLEFEKVFDFAIDVCKLSSGMSGNILLRKFLEQQSSSRNYSTGCPIKKVKFFGILMVNLNLNIQIISGHHSSC
jgi:hypothetical protein